MKVSNLKSEFFLFGNKGNVWSNSSHIAKSGCYNTLCGTPMLSTNHAQLEDVKEIGCKECLKVYEKLPSIEEAKRSLIDIGYTNNELSKWEHHIILDLYNVEILNK